MSFTAAQRRQNRRKYDRNYKATFPFGVRKRGERLEIPDDVERREEHAPCFKCGVRADIPCRHRPWMIAS